MGDDGFDFWFMVNEKIPGASSMAIGREVGSWSRGCEVFAAAKGVRVVGAALAATSGDGRTRCTTPGVKDLDFVVPRPSEQTGPHQGVEKVVEGVWFEFDAPTEFVPGDALRPRLGHEQHHLVGFGHELRGRLSSSMEPQTERSGNHVCRYPLRVCFPPRWEKISGLMLAFCGESSRRISSIHSSHHWPECAHAEVRCVAEVDRPGYGIREREAERAK